MFYISICDEGTGFVSDIAGLENNLAEAFGLEEEITHTISNMVVEGYVVRYYPQQRKVVGEVVFKAKNSGEEE